MRAFKRAKTPTVVFPAVMGAAIILACVPIVFAQWSDPVPLGKLDAFWRYSAVLGPFLEDGQGLLAIPDYVQRGDFPYRKRLFAKEVPFADHLSVVRLLGGYNDGSDEGPPNAAVRQRDLAYRGTDGVIHYRLELLRPRLQPYLDCGYRDFTIVLDNVPWCFPEKPGINSNLGQSSPPHDPQQWRQFVKALCRQLALILGPDAAGHLRFRVGTENNSRARFDGTYAQYVEHYEASASAVREVLPGAKIGPFNISGVSVRGLEHSNVNAFALAEHCAAARMPMDWVAYSRYYRPGDDPDRHAATCREVWEEFERRVPSLKGVSREIHEFGIAPWGEVAKGIFASREPGALGAALTCQMMWRLREAGITRLWHWGVDDRFRGRRGELKRLFTSQAWLLCVMDRMAGGTACLFPPLEKSPSHTEYLAAGSFVPGRALLMLSAYNTDIAKHPRETVSFRISPEHCDLDIATVRFVHLTQQNSVYDGIRTQFAQADLLKADFVSRPDRLGSVREMGKGRAAEILAADHLEQYEQQWVDSLTLKPLTPEIGTVERDKSGITIRVHLTAPEVLVLDMKTKDSS